MVFKHRAGGDTARMTRGAWGARVGSQMWVRAGFALAVTVTLWSPAHAQTGQSAAQTTTRTQLVDSLGRLQTQLTDLSTSQPEVKGRLLELTTRLKVLTLQLELEQELARHADLTQRLAQASPKSGRAKLLAQLEQLSNQQETLNAQFVIAAEQHDEICLGKDE